MATTPNAGRLKLIIAVAVLVIVGGGIAGWLMLSKSMPEYVQFTNGFDFSVTATLKDGSGTETTIQIPAHGRIGADLEGEHTIKIVSEGGETLVDGKVKFATGEKRKEGCFEYYNVLGSAAILVEDVVYGMGMKGGGSLLSGKKHTKQCPTWGFETEKPPEAITVEEHNYGENLSWMHYVGEGDWHASVIALLAKKPHMSDQSRIRAWNLAMAVSKYDPKNPRLAPLGPKFKAACHKMIDMFTTGPLAGQAKRKCLAQQKRMFPAG